MKLANLRASGLVSIDMRHLRAILRLCRKAMVSTAFYQQALRLMLIWISKVLMRAVHDDTEPGHDRPTSCDCSGL